MPVCVLMNASDKKGAEPVRAREHCSAYRDTRRTLMSFLRQ